MIEFAGGEDYTGEYEANTCSLTGTQDSRGIRRAKEKRLTRVGVVGIFS